ncbi:hypothetical protein [Allocoleopsis sp.]
MQLLNHSSTTSNPTIKKAGAKLHMIWVKKIDANQREYLAAVWTTQD